MPGLSPYNRTLEANQKVDINARGTTIFLRQATGEILVRLRSNAVGDRSGESYALNMTQAEEWNHAQEFDAIEITDRTGAANTVELYIGYGRYRKPVPDIVNVSTNVPASDVIDTPVDQTLSGAGNANKDTIAAANSSRIAITIQANKANDQIIRIGDTDVDTDQGIQLEAGEAITIRSKAAIYACEETAGTNKVCIISEEIA